MCVCVLSHFHISYMHNLDRSLVLLLAEGSKLLFSQNDAYWMSAYGLNTFLPLFVLSSYRTVDIKRSSFSASHFLRRTFLGYSFWHRACAIMMTPRNIKKVPHFIALHREKCQVLWDDVLYNYRLCEWSRGVSSGVF